MSTSALDDAWHPIEFQSNNSKRGPSLGVTVEVERSLAFLSSLASFSYCQDSEITEDLKSKSRSGTGLSTISMSDVQVRPEMVHTPKWSFVRELAL